MQHDALLAGARAATGLRRLADDCPLALARLWHRASPATSQLAATRKVLAPGVTAALVRGGNRSGKTKLGAWLAAAYALGAKHAAVRSFAAVNGLDLAAIPADGGRVCAVSLVDGISRRVQRPALAQVLGATATWRGFDSKGEATATTSTGGFVVCKTNDQGARSFQADAWDFLWLDEEPDEAVFNEARMRLADRKGRALITATPLKGLTWLWRRFLDAPEPGHIQTRLDSYDNPHVPRAYLEALLATYGAKERAARRTGDFVVLEGLVYAFDRERHVVAAFRAPRDWPRSGAIDFGTRNPFAFLLFARDPKDDVLHVLREHYQREWTIRRHAEAIRRLCADQPPLDFIVYDPEDKNAALELATEHGFANMLRARKDRDVGMSAVAERLDGDANGRPHLVVHDCCANVVREFEQYAWDPNSPARERTVGDDHAMDAIRYECMKIRQLAHGPLG